MIIKTLKGLSPWRTLRGKGGHWVSCVLLLANFKIGGREESEMDKVGKAGEGARIRLGLRPL